MAHPDPTSSFDAISVVTAAELDAATDAFIQVMVDGRPRRLPVNTMLQFNQTATTAQLEDVDDAINTTGKYVGKMVYNTTTGIPVFADSAAAAGVWAEADGTNEHSPV